MFKLEQRPQASKLWTYGSPVLALAITVLIGVCPVSYTHLRAHET